MIIPKILIEKKIEGLEGDQEFLVCFPYPGEVFPFGTVCDKVG